MQQRPEFLASFGRRVGRKLTPQRQALIGDFLPTIQITAPEGGKTLDLASAFDRQAPVWLEIGFGGGEHLLRLAKQHPDVNLIGAEPYLNGVTSLLNNMQQDPVDNIRIVPDDIRPVMRALSDGSLERIYLLFPDPWPKPRHHKRRIVTQEWLDEVVRLLPVGGVLQLATDHVDYSVWMFEQLLQRGDLRWNAEFQRDWHEPPIGWAPTRYETKTRAQGREPSYFRFIRC